MLVLLPVNSAVITSDALLITKMSLPVPPTKVSTPLLDVITLFRLLPVRVNAALPRPVRFCTFAASVVDTVVCSVLFPELTASIITSDALLITKISLPVPPTRVSAPLFAVITLLSELPVNVMAADPIPVRFCTFAASETETELCSVLVLVPVDSALITSDALLITKTSLPAPPVKVVIPMPDTSASFPDPATRLSVALLPVIVSLSVLPVSVNAAVPMPVRLSRFAGST